MIFVDIMAICWLVFVAYWVISSLRVKRDLSHHGSLWVSVGIRLLIAFAIVLLLRLPLAREVVQNGMYGFLSIHPAIKAVGAVFCAVGVAIAIWARANLGANWSGRPATKEGHELVTSGPYRFVRHPIYSGMLLAMLGTCLISGIPGLLVFVAFSAIAIYRIVVEERLMMQLFADKYLEYRKHTKALIPHIV
jgi:protein-S-isoprenylcysteine O-methyltransferase Ste14